MSTQEYKNITFTLSHDGTVGELAMNRPKKYNAVSFEMLAEIEDCLAKHVNDYNSKVRALVLSGNGKHFTAGIDLKSAASIGMLGDTDAENEDEEPDFARKSIQVTDKVFILQRQTSAIENCRVPVIAAIHGLCLGMGIDMISACDVRLCTKDVKFCIKEVDIGIAADLGTLQRFQKIVANDSWTRELCYTARMFGADEASRFGFVSHVHESQDAVLSAAREMAALIAEKSPVAINITKKSLIYSRDHTVQQGLDHIAWLNGTMLQTVDTSKAVTANFAKKKVKFAKL